MIATDTCLIGGGATCGLEYFHLRFDDYLLAQVDHISQLELWTLCLAVKLWSKQLSGKVIKIQCDNQATVFAVNLGRTKDSFMLHCLREMAWWAAKYNFMVKVEFLCGVRNVLPDLLSRWYKEPEAKRKFRQLTRNKGYKRKYIASSLLNFDNFW